MSDQPPVMTARQVSEMLLKKTASALMTRDFGAFEDAFHLPQVMTTNDSKIRVTDRKGLAQIFEKMCDHFEACGVTSLVRECEAAEYRSPTRVEATHISHVVADSQHVKPPYPVFSVLEWIDGRWKIVSSDYALDDDCGQAVAMKSAGDVTTGAMGIYQEHLDVLSSALIASDFDLFKTRIMLPHRITTETDIIEMKTEAEMRQAFESFAKLYSDQELTDFVRIAKEAHFVTKDEIVGVHISHRMRGDKRILEPYPNRIRLVRGSDGMWRETHCANAILNNSENFRLWTRLADKPRLPDLAIDLERTAK